MQCEFSLISGILYCSDTSPTPSPLLLLPASSLCSGASSIIRSYSTQRGIQIYCTLFNHHLYICTSFLTKVVDCLTQWKDLWLDEAFWHLLFSCLLCVIMVLWRPSQNNQRFPRVSSYNLCRSHYTYLFVIILLILACLRLHFRCFGLD